MPQKLIRSVARAKNPKRLGELVGSLSGKKCWKAAFGYGQELFLHFGAQIAIKHPKLRGQKEGEWIFGTRGTPWILYTRNGALQSTDGEKRRIEGVRSALEGRKVVEVEAGKRAKFYFDNDALLEIRPTADDDRYQLPYWELFTPDHMLIAFGPGNEWSYRRSNLPER